MYKFRNYPVSWSDGHCICGEFEDESGSSFGVQEWCINKEDAQTLLAEMKKDNKFSRLSIEFAE